MTKTLESPSAQAVCPLSKAVLAPAVFDDQLNKPGRGFMYQANEYHTCRFSAFWAGWPLPIPERWGKNLYAVTEAKSTVKPGPMVEERVSFFM